MHSRPEPALHFIWYAALAITLVGATVILGPDLADDFGRFFGGPNPIAVVAGAGILGAGCLALLGSVGGFRVAGSGVPEAADRPPTGTLRRRSVRGLVLSALGALIFGTGVIGADLLLRYPRDLNIPVPEAFLFYPVVGLVAEVAFHLVPLAAVLGLAALIRCPVTSRTAPGIAMAAAVVAEPTFQIVFDGSSLTWLDAYTWVHVLAISAAQVWVFRRFGFMTMYAFRLMYYAVWHIAWGTIRLELLF